MSRTISLLNSFVFCLLAAGVLAQPTDQQASAGFIENRGQIRDQGGQPNNDVLFLYTGPGIRIQLRRTGYSYELFKIGQAEPGQQKSCTHTRPKMSTVQTARVDIDFEGAAATTDITTGLALPGAFNYYLNGGTLNGVHAFKQVSYHNVYPGIDIEFLIQDNSINPLKYNITLRPRAKMADIRLLVKGARQLGGDSAHIDLQTALGTIRESIPYSTYPGLPGSRVPLHFQLLDEGFAFSGNYDHSKTLVIDPASNLIWGTYYGGSSIDYCTCTSIDGQNQVYLSGHCFSTNHIATSGSFESTENGDLDAYLAKFDANGSRLWATYFGGSGYDQIFSMCVTGSGMIYLSGDTDSPNGIASSNAFQPVYGGGIDDVLLAKFDAGGNRLWSTYYGGTMHDISQAVLVDRHGDLVLAGHSESANGIATAGAYNTTYSFNFDVYVAKFDSSGNRLWGTYYGDTGIDEAYGLACDASDNIYVTGMTQSVAGIAAGNGFQMGTGGLQDAYLAKFDPTGSSLIWGTYYGGNGNDLGTCLKINNEDVIFLCGNTNSSNNLATAGAYQTSPGSSDDGFMASFQTDGARTWGSFFGGENVDYINGLVLDQGQQLILCGQTLSHNSIATAAGYQDTISSNGNYDAFFVKFTPGGLRRYGSYFGGPGNDNGRAIAVDQSGKIFLAGETTSSVDIATPGALQPAPGGAQDGFLARLCMPYTPLASTTGSIESCMGTTTLDAQNGLASYLWNNAYSSNPLVVTETVPGTYLYSVFVTDTFGCSGADSLWLVINDCYVSIPELSPGDAVDLYPIPAHNSVTCDITALRHVNTLQVYNAAGQLMLTLPAGQQTQMIDISMLPAGLYTLCANDGENRYRRKFIKD